MSITTGRRTTLRPGAAAEYDRVHEQIPAAVLAALGHCGVIQWHIWRDGDLLFHSIETTDGYERMLETITALGPIDAPWDAVIASLLDSEPGADRVLPLVWAMDAMGQHSGAGPSDRS